MMSTHWKSTRTLAQSLTDLAWPRSCGACGAWGEMLCEVCRRDLRPHRVVTQPVWASGLEVHAASTFDGPVRHALTAFKDEGRRDLGPPLAALLSDAATYALTAVPTTSRPRAWCRVLAPSSRAALRRRGRFPLHELARQISPPISPGPVLEFSRGVKDQSGLGRAQRRENLAGALRVQDGATMLPPGTGVLLIDDVVTTGATLAAAHAAVSTLRPAMVVAATIAAREFPRAG